MIAGKFAGEMNMISQTNGRLFFGPGDVTATAAEAGFRLGSIGTHTSRTIMLEELSTVLAAVRPTAGRQDYASAIIEANCLGKRTASTRRLTNQRLGELYGLNPVLPVFRILRRLWTIDAVGRPLLALLCSLARDPLLMATAPAVLSLPAGSELLREPLRQAVARVTGERLNEKILDKVLRNASSSWAQAGHLEGRTFKRRKMVNATPATAAFALWLGYSAGLRGVQVFESGWFWALDCSSSIAQAIALEAKRAGLVDLRVGGDVVDLDLRRLDPGYPGD